MDFMRSSGSTHSATSCSRDVAFSVCLRNDLQNPLLSAHVVSVSVSSPCRCTETMTWVDRFYSCYIVKLVEGKHI